MRIQFGLNWTKAKRNKFQMHNTFQIHSKYIIMSVYELYSFK